MSTGCVCRDRTAINLPLSRFAIIIGKPIRIAADADEIAIGHARQAIEDELNAVTTRAYAVVDEGAEKARQAWHSAASCRAARSSATDE